MKTLVCAVILALIGLAPGLSAYGQQTVSQDSIRAENNRYLEVLRTSIAGKENQPAPEVFKNIHLMTRSDAGRLLSVMDFGFSRSLGVSCTHCHVPDQWSSDEKTPKRIAREMSEMVKTINTTLLSSITDIKSENPIVNCTTCHRGEIKPALDLTR